MDKKKLEKLVQLILIFGILVVLMTKVDSCQKKKKETSKQKINLNVALINHLKSKHNKNEI